MKRLVIGILAHVDSGKTTLSEAILYQTGEIRSLGRVDHGDAFLDTNEIERDRGITIFSKQAEFKTDKFEITLLDTPGHVDFSAETERVLSVLDYAILVISASDGVQSHTETLWQMLKSYDVPVFIFVNKMDMEGYGKNELMENLRTNLSDGCVDFTEIDEELLAMCDEELLGEFLESGAVSKKGIISAIKKRHVFPCAFGSALKNQGVDELLRLIDEYAEENEYGSQFGASVYKISEDAQGNRLTHMKITGGELRTRELICGRDKKGEEWSEKINQIRIYSGEKYTTRDLVKAGEVCVVTGLSKTFAGEGLGSMQSTDGQITEPYLTYRLELPEGIDAHTALANLRLLESEEPVLNVIWNERLREIHVSLMGEVQLEVLKRIIADRFGMEVTFGQGSILYKETIANTVEGMGHYEPLRHYAEVRLCLEPMPRGSGLVFESRCSEEILEKNWQRLILTHLEEKTHIGALCGAPITDMKITLTSGRAHKKHTEGGDFRQATYRAVRQGLMSAEKVLLEPWFDFRLELPTSAVGRAMTDIGQMGGKNEYPVTSGEISVISGTAPVSAMREYHTEVLGYTSGRGRLSCVVRGYEPCHNQEEIIEKTAYDAERDIDNPADSVFCAHGAGFTVKWNEVAEYMHTESTLKKARDEAEVLRAREYINRVADDSELIKIFEMTYGPIKRRGIDAMKTVKKPPQTASEYKPRKQREKKGEYLLVDGYNIIFAWEDLKKIAEENLDLARTMLLNRLINYQGFKECRVILVFDAYKVKGNREEVEKHGGVSIVYTKEAETADTYIERTTHELSRDYHVRVATSDGLEQLIILGNGAFRISAETFLTELQAVEKAIGEAVSELRVEEGNKIPFKE